MACTIKVDVDALLARAEWLRWRNQTCPVDCFIAGMSFFRHDEVLVDTGVMFITGGNEQLHPPVEAQNLLIDLSSLSVNGASLAEFKERVVQFLERNYQPGYGNDFDAYYDSMRPASATGVLV